MELWRILQGCLLLALRKIRVFVDFKSVPIRNPNRFPRTGAYADSGQHQFALFRRSRTWTSTCELRFLDHKRGWFSLFADPNFRRLLNLDSNQVPRARIGAHENSAIYVVVVFLTLVCSACGNSMHERFEKPNLPVSNSSCFAGCTFSMATRNCQLKSLDSILESELFQPFDSSRVCRLANCDSPTSLVTNCNLQLQLFIRMLDNDFFFW